MYEYLKGILAQATPLYAVLDVHGIGYKIFLPLSHFAKLPKSGVEVLFYVSFVVREDSQTLYGFLSSAERDLFIKLTEVSGIGPKTALALIGHLPSEDLQMAIAHANVSLLCKVPGIGKKTAERLVVEMRDKCKNFLEKSIVQGEKESDIVSDAVGALVNLGYNPLQAQKSVKQVLQSKPSADLATLITLALRSI